MRIFATLLFPHPDPGMANGTGNPRRLMVAMWSPKPSWFMGADVSGKCGWKEQVRVNFGLRSRLCVSGRELVQEELLGHGVCRTSTHAN